MLSGQQVAEARRRAGLSQATVARGAGINRTVLSAFETGQLVIGEAMERGVRSFFAERDETFSDDPGAAGAAGEGASVTQQSAVTATELWLVDGKVIPSDMDDERIEALADELVDVQDRIAGLKDRECDGDFFIGRNGSSGDDRKCFDELKLLTARAHCLTESMQGRPTMETMTDDEWADSSDTVGNRLSREFGRFFGADESANVDS